MAKAALSVLIPVALIGIVGIAAGVGKVTFTVLPFSGLNYPQGVAVDQAGDVYVSDSPNHRVLKLAAGSSTPTVLLFTGLDATDLAVDPAGDLFITDSGSNRVVEVAAGSTTPTVLPFTGLFVPVGVAVDRVGDVYVTDYGNSRVVELAAGATAQTVLPFTGLQYPNGVGVDTDRNLYVADQNNSRVVEMAAGATAQTVLPFTGLDKLRAVAVNTAGDVYATDGATVDPGWFPWHQNSYGRVLKLAAGSTTQTAAAHRVRRLALGVAVDAAGNVYAADEGHNRVVKLPAGCDRQTWFGRCS